MSNKNVCVVGAGYWGKNHIRTLHELAALGGIVEPNQDTLNRFTKQYPNVKGFFSLDEALREKQFLGFTVASPAETHFKVARKIILSKKHVLVEKPFTLNIEDTKFLVKLGKESNVNIMVGHVLLFHPAIRKIKELIQNGIIGKLQYIYSNRLNFGKVRRSENALWSLAPHDISVFQYFTDSFPIDINASGSIFLQQGIHDSTIVHLKYPNGVEGHIFVSWLHPFKEHRLVVSGSQAMITFEDSVEGKPLRLYDKKYDIIQGIPEKTEGKVTFIEYEKEMALTAELKYFVKHINGTKLIKSNGGHALEWARIMDLVSKQLQQSLKQ